MNNWLQYHIEREVIPLILESARVKDPHKERVWRPAKDAAVPELGILNACLSSLPRKCTFPHWPYYTLNGRDQSYDVPVPIRILPTVPDNMHVFVKHTWNSIKVAANTITANRGQYEGGVPILLPGRDVFLWEIMARQEDYPTWYAPEVSRLTVEQWVQENPKAKGMFAFDTGFMGSVLRPFHERHEELRRRSGLIIVSHHTKYSCGLLGSADQGAPYAQVFPKLRGARHVVLEIEGLPKYYKRGFLESTSISYYGQSAFFDNPLIQYPVQVQTSRKIKQEPAPIHEIVEAARFTIAFWYKQSPRFIKGGMSNEAHVMPKHLVKNKPYTWL